MDINVPGPKDRKKITSRILAKRAQDLQKIIPESFRLPFVVSLCLSGVVIGEQVREPDEKGPRPFNSGHRNQVKQHFVFG